MKGTKHTEKEGKGLAGEGQKVEEFSNSPEQENIEETNQQCLLVTQFFLISKNRPPSNPAPRHIHPVRICNCV